MRWLLLLLLGACARDLTGTPPPPESFYFPVGVTVSPTQPFAYVINANANQKYNASWISVVDLKTLSIVNQISVPTLAYKMAMNKTGTRLVVPIRGLGAFGLLDVQGKDVQCMRASDGARLSECTSSELYKISSEIIGSDVQSDVADIFATTFVDVGPQTYLSLGFFSNGYTLHYPFVSETTFAEPKVLFLGNTATSALTPYPQLNSTDPVFLMALSQRINNGETNTVLYSIDLQKALSDSQEFAVQSKNIGTTLGGLDGASLIVTPNGEQTLVSESFSNNQPGALALVDTTLKTSSRLNSNNTLVTLTQPFMQPLYAAALPAEPTSSVYVPRSNDEGLLFVASFSEDIIYIFGVQKNSLTLLHHLTDISTGPVDMAYAQVDNRSLLLVTTFFDHSLIVIDISASSPQAFNVLKRLRNEEIPAAPVTR